LKTAPLGVEIAELEPVEKSVRAPGEERDSTSELRSPGTS